MSDKSVRPTRLFNLYKLTRSRFSQRRRPLWPPPGVEDRNLMHARNCAMRRARLLRQILAANVIHRVLLQRNRRIPALLRAVMYEPVFANVEIARASPAAPMIRLTQRDVVLERVDPGEAALLERLHFVVHSPLLVA